MRGAEGEKGDRKREKGDGERKRGEGEGQRRKEEGSPENGAGRDGPPRARPCLPRSLLTGARPQTPLGLHPPDRPHPSEPSAKTQTRAPPRPHLAWSRSRCWSRSPLGAAVTSRQRRARGLPGAVVPHRREGRRPLGAGHGTTGTPPGPRLRPRSRSRCRRKRRALSAAAGAAGSIWFPPRPAGGVPGARRGSESRSPSHGCGDRAVPTPPPGQPRCPPRPTVSCRGHR